LSNFAGAVQVFTFSAAPQNPRFRDIALVQG
jgi:hypothetical protein